MGDRRSSRPARYALGEHLLAFAVKMLLNLGFGRRLDGAAGQAKIHHRLDNVS
jgi:hypothetical protein